MRPAFLSATNTSRRGFSLVEFAVVVGIISIILSAIWVYAGQASETSRRQQLAEQINTVVNNVHALYAGQANISGTLDKLVTTLATQNAIPSTMVRNGAPCTNLGPPAGLCADNPWGSGGNPTGGTFGVCAWASGAAADKKCATAGNGITQLFAIEISGLTLAQCINIVPQNSGSSGPTGLLDVTINSKSAIKAGNPLPVPVAFATAQCATATPSTVDFVYRLQAGAF